MRKSTWSRLSQFDCEKLNAIADNCVKIIDKKWYDCQDRQHELLLDIHEQCLELLREEELSLTLECLY